MLPFISLNGAFSFSSLNKVFCFCFSQVVVFFTICTLPHLCTSSGWGELRPLRQLLLPLYISCKYDCGAEPTTNVALSHGVTNFCLYYQYQYYCSTLPVRGARFLPAFRISFSCGFGFGFVVEFAIVFFF